ncbi:MAG: leucine-rich repeat domain-containing protein [Williamsia sp.]|nr:leucine-rich repeat domain-containing protein [Williamsia sp.]
MMDMALRLIEENKRTKAKFLDLGNCGLENELPEELFECEWLEGLSLGNFFYDEENEPRYLENECERNAFENINLLGFKRLGLLRKLFLNNSNLSDISFLQHLTGLQSLDLRYNQITDISFLQHLTGLQSLDLRYNQITDISFLQNLTSSKSLDLSSNHISNFSFLQHLTSLQSLDLSFNQVTDISFLQNLTNLQSLDLSYNQITDVSFLQNLTNLQKLDLRSNQISDISFLRHLTGLQRLNSSSNKITDISFLQHLAGLQSLNISSNEITDISFLQHLTGLQSLNLRYNQITDISFLQNLTSLKSLDLSSNHIRDFNFLQHLTGLQSLDLRCNQITDISFLQHLTSLQSLDLSSNHISNFSFLQHLTSLQSLDLSSNHITFLVEDMLYDLPSLTYLNLENNTLLNVPSQISNQSNCFDDLINFFKGRKRESIPLYEAKILLIGNGRVGKTSLVKRLVHDTFNPAGLSTHAIQLEEWQLPELAREENLQRIQLNIWDFGGQEIYHSAHRYFMQTQAVFLLVWDAQTEEMPEQQEVTADGSTVSYKNRSLHYWLNYIKTQSNRSPAIIVQTKRDTDGEKDPGLTAKEKQQYNVRVSLAVECSKKLANGFKALQEKIEELIVEELKTGCKNIPAQWSRVRTSIAERQRNGVTQITLEEFAEMCYKEGLDGGSAETLLRYLHNCGVFYYKPNLFNNQIVIDQKWAIDAIYTLFDRSRLYMEIQKDKISNSKLKDGQFTGKQLQRVWNQFTDEEQKLFVSFMKQCEICFEQGNSWNVDQLPLKERKFIAPQLLPEEKPAAVQFAFSGDEGIYFKYKHQFLLDAVIQRFIVRTSFLTGTSYMWNKGVLIKTTEGTALVEAFPETNEVLIRIKETDYTRLLDKIRNELKEINRDEKGIQETVSLEGRHFVSLNKLRTHLSHTHNEEIQAEDGHWVPVAAYRQFLRPDEQMRFNKVTDKPLTPEQAGNKQKIYFSYAWRDATNEDREKFIDELYHNLKLEDEYTVVRDKEDLGYKGSISAFMKEIGRGDLVVVAISDKYLKSDYCMYELHELYLNSKSQLEELRKKIFPIRIESLSLSKPKTQKIYMDHWYDLKKDWEELVHSPSKNATPKQHEKLHKIVSIEHELGDFLEFIADINTLTPSLLSQNNFEEIKNAIKQQAAEIKKD